MRLKFTYLFFIFSLNSAIGQEYISAEEKEVFENYRNDSLNYDFIKALSVITKQLTPGEFKIFKTKLDTFIGELPTKEEKEKKERKRVRKIYNLTHDTFLKKYEDIAYFPELIEEGVYNCVTSTALYSYVLESLNIPYYVKELPSHVYLIAYPKTLNIELETTAPGTYGFVSRDASEISDAVENLIKLKLVTKEEVLEKGEKEVFQNYFYGKEFVDKKALIGMQYFNKALQHIEKEDLDNALNDIEKSLVFFPYPQSEYLRTYLLASNLENIDLNTQENINKLVDGLSILQNEKDFNFASLQYYLNKIIQNDDNDVAFIEQATLQLNNFESKDLNDEVTEYMYLYIATKHAESSSIDEALNAADIVLKINPKSKKAKEIVMYMVLKKEFIMSKSEAGYQDFNDLYKVYPFLTGNSNIETVKASFAAQVSYSFYAKNEFGKAIKYRTIFESQMDTYKDKIQVNPEAISNLYLFAGRKFYGKKHYQKALTIFNKGLSYNPLNPELQKMVKWAKEDLKQN